MTKQLVSKRSGVGDAAIYGLVAGIGAGVVMAAYLALGGLFFGEDPASILARFAPNKNASPVVGALMHLAMSGVYGVVFGVIAATLLGLARGRWIVRGLGVAYGIALVAVALTMILPSAKSPLLSIPSWHLAAAHILYGLALGVALTRGAR